MSVSFPINNLGLLFNRYNGQWFTTPLQTQKLILFLLQRSNKPFTLNLSGLFVGCIESFTVVMSLIAIQYLKYDIFHTNNATRYHIFSAVNEGIDILLHCHAFRESIMQNYIIFDISRS